MKIKIKKFIATTLALAFALIGTSVSAFAAEPTPVARIAGNNTVVFSNIETMQVNETVEFEVTDAQGQPATIGLQRMPSTARADGTEWKVWYTGVTINAHFYMTVSNNKVTSVYDEWIMTLGGTFSNENLTKTSTTGKLSFTVDAYAGVASFKCWLKGTVTGSNNDININWQM